MAVTTHFISYYKNDGSGTMDTVMERYSFVLPAITNIPNGADWSRPGYSFLGWNEFSDGSGTTYQPGDSITPTSDMDFYALWSVAPPDGVVVSYNGNDIATLNSTGSAVLATDGTLMADDVTITYTEPSPSLQSKNVSPTESPQSIEPDAGYDGLSRVNVGAISSIYVGSSIQRQAAQTITPTTADQTIASGKYLTGTQTIKGDANLVAANIADGVTIFGVTGTHQGGGTVSLLPAVIRPDAELVKSYTFDKWIVADDGISIPAYTTTATTIYKSVAISDKYTCDFSQYDYFAVLRFLSYPQYGSSVHANHMQEYDIRAVVVDFCEIPSYSLRSFDNTASISTRYVTLFSANQTANVYWTSASALAKATSANAGAYQFISIPKLSGSTVTFYESQRILKGDATVFNQSAWESATDIRFQYVQQLYRSRKGTLNVNGWCSTSNTAVALGAISNNGNLS